MIRQYIKQSWVQARQNKTFTAIYVGGVALAIATTMIFAIAYYVKLAPIYPEANRDRMLYARVARFETKEGNSTQWAWSLQAVREMFYPLKSAEVVSAENTNNNVSYIQPFDDSGDYSVFLRYVDPAFFKVYEFRFTEGKPFTEADLSAGIRTAVLTDVLAEKIFGIEESVVGRTFVMDDMEYRVAGVVESCTTLTTDSYAELYVPYSAANGYDVQYGTDYYGSYHVRILASDVDGGIDAVKAEVAESVRKYNAGHSDYELKVFEDPVTHLEQAFQDGSNRKISWSDIIRRYGIFVLVLLLVPALNLSGMIAGQMDGRIKEIGVRKSYGASRGALLNQVLVENFVLTLGGGVFGLLLSWGFIALCKDWIFTVVTGGRIYQADVTGEMLFSPTVFIVALGVCMVLNLLSALVPAWNALRREIVKSLNEKR